MRILISFLLCIALHSTKAQDVKIDSSYNNTYYQGRMELFENLPLPEKSIVFLGNSITERGIWHELIPGKIIINRGIGGDNTFGVRARLARIVESKPKKIFLLIGINDIGRGLPIEVIASNYRKIIEHVKRESPKTKLYAQSVLPMNDNILTAGYLKNKGHLIVQLNDEIQKPASQYHIVYVNVYNEFDAGSGKLKPELTMDGIHVRPAAYVLWVDYLKKKNYL